MSPIMMEVIEWFDQTGTGIVQRYPEDGSGDIKMGAQLIVRENQAAVFFRDGQGLDVLGPGRHTLSTQNLPILTRLLSLSWGFQSPFRAEVYFVNSLVGTQGSYTTDQIEDYLREVIVARLNDFLGETVQSLLELPRQYDEMAVAVKTRLAEEFRKYGTEMVDFYINRITPPEDVERMIDECSSMGAVGDLDRFLKFKAAKAMGDAAQGHGAGVDGGAAAGVGVGVGAGLGMMMPGMLAKSLGTDLAGASVAAVTCPGCQAAVAADSRFCPRCGRQIATTTLCARCQAELPAGARFCSACGQAVPGA